MFDRIIYTILDTIVDWCERYRKYRIKRSLPRECYDQKARDKGLKKWVNERTGIASLQDGPIKYKFIKPSRK